MVSLALDQSNEASLAVAGDVAEKFDACVIGVAAAEFSPPLYYTSGEAAQSFIDQGYASINKRMAELESQFRDALQKRAKEIDWRSAREMPSTYVVKQSRAADILIAIGSSSALADPFTGANPNDLVMQIGRPLLLVPPTVQWLDLRSVLIAWKDCREARRAIVDALPMLRKAKDITVAAIVEEEDNPSVVSAGVEDVVGWLSRHGIFASELVAEGNGSATAQLDRIAADTAAGIVVAGAYGHSRFREWVLGGMTRHLVADSTRCSLLSR
jgi:nucleotide-binding universal stress UspA family protein